MNLNSPIKSHALALLGSFAIGAASLNAVSYVEYEYSGAFFSGFYSPDGYDNEYIYFSGRLFFTLPCKDEVTGNTLTIDAPKASLTMRRHLPVGYEEFVYSGPMSIAYYDRDSDPYHYRSGIQFGFNNGSAGTYIRFELEEFKLTGPQPNESLYEALLNLHRYDYNNTLFGTPNYDGFSDPIGGGYDAFTDLIVEFFEPTIISDDSCHATVDDSSMPFVLGAVGITVPLFLRKRRKEL